MREVEAPMDGVFTMDQNAFTLLVSHLNRIEAECSGIREEFRMLNGKVQDAHLKLADHRGRLDALSHDAVHHKGRGNPNISKRDWKVALGTVIATVAVLQFLQRMLP
jgi:hypothetical protein